MINPFRLSGIPEADRADVEKHRISEHEETLRRLGESLEKSRQKREETKQKWIESNSIVPICIVAIVVSICAGVSGYNIYHDREATERARLGFTSPDDRMIPVGK